MWRRALCLAAPGKRSAGCCAGTMSCLARCWHNCLRRLSQNGREISEPLLDARAASTSTRAAVSAASSHPHQVLPKAATADRRVIIIGDVHGCADELDDLLAKVNYDPNGDLVIFAGDLIAKGPDSLRVVRKAQELNALGVLGNHDSYAVARLTDDLYPDREHTKLARQVLSDQDMEYLKNLPLSIKLEQFHVTVVHAGLLPDSTPAANTKSDLLHMRNVERVDGEWKATSDSTKGVPWVSEWKGPEHIVFGHDAVRKLQKTEFATGLDTGCVYGGALSALLLPGHEVVSVMARKTYLEPGKKG